MLIRKKVSSPFLPTGYRFWLEYLKAHLRFFTLLFKNSFKVRCILFYPDFPAAGSTIDEICRYLGYNMTNNPLLPHELSIFWQEKDSEHNLSENLSIQAFAPRFNRYCHNFSQQQAKEIFEGLLNAIKPHAFALNDMKLRIYWVKNHIPIIHVIVQKDSTSKPDIKIVRAKAALSDEEIQQIKNFIHVIGLDFGVLEMERKDKKLVFHEFSSQSRQREEHQLPEVLLNEHYILLAKAFKEAFLDTKEYN